MDSNLVYLQDYVSKAHASYPSKSSSAISSPQNPPQSKQGGGSCLWRFDLLHPSPPLCRPLIPPQPPWFKYTGLCLGDWKKWMQMLCWSEIRKAVGQGIFGSCILFEMISSVRFLQYQIKYFKKLFKTGAGEAGIHLLWEGEWIGIFSVWKQ